MNMAKVAESPAVQGSSLSFYWQKSQKSVSKHGAGITEKREGKKRRY
jgi:hypothetical protein